MSYTNATSHFRIPYMKSGDVLTEEGEALQWATLDNLLFGLCLGLPSFIIAEGSYSISEAGGVKYLSLSSIGGISFAGIVNKRLCYSTTDVISSDLSDGSVNYVYVVYNLSVDLDPDAFTMITSTTVSTNPSHILVATVDLTGVSPSIDTSTGKVYAASIYSHVNGSVNPHGTTLTQTNLNCTNGVFGGITTDEITLMDQSMYGAVYDTVVSAGSTGVTWSLVGFVPKFAIVYGEEAVGEVTWTISDGVLTIKNSGATGVNMNVKIDVEPSV